MAKYSSAIQIVGLGGTGTNVIEAFIRNKEALIPLLQEDKVRVSLLAIDVADHDIISLESAYKNLVKDLEKKNISSDKIQLVAKSVKFPTPETMFEFIQNYPNFLESDGIKPPSNYTPWLSSSLEIPPLAGGVGRKRALSKAIYGLNYHHLKLVDNFMDIFKQQVFSSTIQQHVFMIYGIGGGTGSGIALDLARHLRTKLGSSIPIIGLGILPCDGDDPPAKGVSSYSAILEHGAVLDRSSNQEMMKEYGDGYQNPFSAFLMMPLSPAYGSNEAGLVEAKKIVDNAIVDILYKSLNFDLADLLSNIGSSVDSGSNWVNVISTLKVSYPIEEFREATLIYLNKLEKLRDLRNEKQEISRGSKDTDIGLLHVLNASYTELVDVYKRMQIQKQLYNESTFEKDLDVYVTEGTAIESKIKENLTGGDKTLNEQINELENFAKSIAVNSEPGSTEYTIRTLTLDILNSCKDISKNYKEFTNGIEDTCRELDSTLPSSQNLKTRQKQIIKDIIVFGKIVSDYIEGVKYYVRSKYLAEKLLKDLSKTGDAESKKQIDRVKKQSAELINNRRFANSLCSLSVEDERKNVAEMLVDTRNLKKSLIENLEKLKTEHNNYEETIKKRENEILKIESQTKGIKLGFLGSKKKKFESQLNKLRHELRIIKDEYDLCRKEIQTIEKKTESYSNIESKFDVNSSYRNLLADVSTLSVEHSKKLQIKDPGLYDRVAQLTDGESNKIMDLVLTEQEDSLKDVSYIVNEIIDKDHLRDYLVSALKVFGTPDNLGLTPDYSTDYIWFTVVSPRKLWDKDLESSTKTILSRYSTTSASKSIYIREVESDDPWTIRFMIIAAKAKAEHLASFKEMNSQYKGSSISEKLLSHSLLLEHGVHAAKGNKFISNDSK
jgi:uncharacterized protein YukE